MTDFRYDDADLERMLGRVRQLIDEQVGTSHLFIRPVLLDHVRAKGKMLRPALTLIMAMQDEKVDAGKAVKTAATVELIHLASLIHDDIIDEADRRRGLPTVYSRVGARQAVLAGDYLLTLALSLMDTGESNMDTQIVYRLLSHLCESELNQDAAQGDFGISPETYLQRIAGKTASLFALACYAGATVADQSREACALCHRIGYRMGMAFQNQDDILDIAGTETTLGKQVGNDLRCGIPTLPTIKALQRERTLGQNALARLLDNRVPLSAKDTASAVSLIADLGGIAEAGKVAGTYRRNIGADIDRLSHPLTRRRLHSLLEKLSKRTA